MNSRRNIEVREGQELLQALEPLHSGEKTTVIEEGKKKSEAKGMAERNCYVMT